MVQRRINELYHPVDHFQLAQDNMLSFTLAHRTAGLYTNRDSVLSRISCPRIFQNWFSEQVGTR